MPPAGISPARTKFRPPEDAPTPDASFFTAFETLPAFCRVQTVSAPTSNSHIALEVWLPSSGWNGRYVGAGNGGYGGSINYYRLAEAINAGYVGSSTDTGHRGAMSENREVWIDDPSSGVERTRPLCRYPQEATWAGKGSSDAAANYTCTAKAR